MYRLFWIVIGIICFVHGQDVYKTPYGKKYHLVTCSMVENVSKKITISSAALTFGLHPCKILNMLIHLIRQTRLLVKGRLYNVSDLLKKEINVNTKLL